MIRLLPRLSYKEPRKEFTVCPLSGKIVHIRVVGASCTLTNTFIGTLETEYVLNEGREIEVVLCKVF